VNSNGHIARGQNYFHVRKLNITKYRRSKKSILALVDNMNPAPRGREQKNVGWQYLTDNLYTLI
jgi:hypothetical protein